MRRSDTFTRRSFLGAAAAAGAVALIRPPRAFAYPAPAPGRPGAIVSRPIPSNPSESLPLVGLGTWGTFNVGDDKAARDSCADVMRAFFADGGRLIDSSPMYGSSQEVVGYGLAKLGHPQQVFAADKVWTPSGGAGPAQIAETQKLWGLPRMDLLEVHNVEAWEEHLPTLFAMKKAGKVRYVGVTTSHGRRHDVIERIMRSQPIDFVQITYNAADREIESRILPLALERKIAVVCNRPFQRGALIDRVGRAKLPAYAAEIDCVSWPQLLLKFIVSHPAVACAIPATTRVDHVRENVAASYGRMPDEAMRKRIATDVEKA